MNKFTKNIIFPVYIRRVLYFLQDVRNPSDDSGVDVRAKAGNASQSGSSYTDTMTR